MNWITFLYVAMASSLLTIIWQLLFHVYPAWRRVKISRSLAALARCLTVLNQDSFLNSKINHDHELHDQYYKFLFNAFTHRINLRFNMLKSITHDGEDKKSLRRFKREISGIDKETRILLNDASFAIGKMLLLRNPIIFILVFWKIKRSRYSFLTREKRRMEVMKTAEFISLNAINNEDYLLIPAHT